MSIRDHSVSRTRGRAAATARTGLLSTAAAALALAALAWAVGCGSDAASTAASASPSSVPTVAVSTPAKVEGPPKFAGGICERTTADRKSLPGTAQATIERFVAAVDRGDTTTMRALLDPNVAGETLAGLRHVTRLGLLELEDRY